MIKRISILILISLTLACATKPTEDLPLSQEDQRIRAVIFSVDSKIWGDYGRKHNGEYSNFTETDHNKQLAKLNAPRAQEMRDLMPLFSTKEFTGYPGTFVFCGFAPRLGIAFCDDAACQGTEFFSRRTSSQIIDQWKKQLPKSSCSK